MDLNEIARLRDTYARDGVVHIPQALGPRCLKLAEEAFNWSMAHPGPLARSFEGGTGTFYNDLLNPDALPAYRALLETSETADVVAALWPKSDVWFLYEQIFLKEGGESRRTPWHQDSSYLPIEGDTIAVMWIPFDPVAKEDALEFVRGSHRGVLYDGSTFDPKDDTTPLYGDGSMPRLPDIEKNRSAYDILSWGCVPGDVLVFHPAILHGGAPTHVGTRRRTLSLRFFGDDARYASRPGFTENEDSLDESVFGQMRRTLDDGAPFRHPYFPRIREKPLAA
jgi:ectoine hydroxylase-related dioxygenase (phytanoyl-CoA dioxygenase family)